jgi:hypothetical protein
MLRVPPDAGRQEQAEPPGALLEHFPEEQEPRW